MEKLHVLELPVKLIEMSVENTKKSMELTFGYLQQLEKSQREVLKSTYELCNQTFPGEGKIWEIQTGMMEKGFELIDKTYEKFVPLWK